LQERPRRSLSIACWLAAAVASGCGGGAMKPGPVDGGGPPAKEGAAPDAIADAAASDIGTQGDHRDAVAREGGADGPSLDRPATGDAGVAGDPCVPAGMGYAPEATPNDDPDHATPLALGAPFQGCIQSVDDVDYYQFTIPSDAQGGFVTISASNLGPQTIIGLVLSSASTNGTIRSIASARVGAGFSFWFVAAAGASFRLRVDHDFADIVNLGPYTLTAAYMPVVEPNEPNGDLAHATPIQVGSSVQGMFFSGFIDDQHASSEDDYFKVTLPVGTASASLSNVAVELTATVQIYDGSGFKVGGKTAASPGADVLVTWPVAGPGDYYVDVTCDFYAPSMTVLPSWATQPYRLVVTSQP
jgi:hypothetical protein